MFYKQVQIEEPWNRDCSVGETASYPKNYHLGTVNLLNSYIILLKFNLF